MQKFNYFILFTILGSFLWAQSPITATSQEPNRNASGVNAIVGDCFRDAATCFYKTVAEFKATCSPSDFNDTIASEAYCYYLQKNWTSLEQIFNAHQLNGGWPPCYGGYDTENNVPLKAGMKFDRYGGAIRIDNNIPILGGSFTAPYAADGSPYSFESRALNNPRASYDFYYEIKVLKDLDFNGQLATVIPWFGQAGNGKQVNWFIPIDSETGYPKTWNKLAQEGFIQITILDTPSGTHSALKGLVIPSPIEASAKDSPFIKDK